MLKYRSTTEIIKNAERIPEVDSFFARFGDAFDSVNREILKLETRQEYHEPGNPSWEEMARGNIDQAMNMLPAMRAEDAPLYEEFRQKGVEFIRCRPVTYPLTRYLEWELGSYEINSEQGETILFTSTEDVIDLLSSFARHDFMVFDEFLAFVHDYDSTGEIRGGWVVSDSVCISELRRLFSDFRENCIDFRLFIAHHNQLT